MLIAGSFTTVGGTARVRLAGLDGATGALGPISVSINNTVNDLELDDAGNVVYLAGTFGNVGGSMRNRLAGDQPGRPGTVTPLALPGITGNLSAVTLDGNGGLLPRGSFQITPEKDNPAVIARVAIATAPSPAVVPYYETPRSLARPAVERHQRRSRAGAERGIPARRRRLLRLRRHGAQRSGGVRPRLPAPCAPTSTRPPTVRSTS